MHYFRTAANRPSFKLRKVFMDNNFTESLHQLVQKINDPMWTGLVYVLLGAGLFFTVATGFVQFRLLGRSIKEMLGGRQQGDDPHGITPFQAFVTGLASRVGGGNTAGAAGGGMRCDLRQTVLVSVSTSESRRAAAMTTCP